MENRIAAEAGRCCAQLSAQLQAPATLRGVAVTLNAEHSEKLRQSALTAEQAAALGWSSRPDGSLLIPYRNPNGSPQTMPDGSPWVRWRLPQAEIDANPKGGKYRSRRESGCRVYHPALSKDHDKRLVDCAVPLRIIEGELKAEACAAHDPRRVTIAIGGVDAWRDRRNGKSKSEPLPELAGIPMEGREVRLCSDSDINKPGVRAAMTALAVWLATPVHEGGKGATVYFERLPNAPERNHKGEIVRLGADDLIYNHGVRGFLRLCDIAENCIVLSEDKETGKIERSFRLPFAPEPDTKEATFIRAEYLTALLGRTWRSDPERPDGWQRWTGTHWERIDGNDQINAAVERFLDCQGWRVARKQGEVKGLIAAFRRQIEPVATARASKGLLPFRNGCLVIGEDQFINHDPAHGNTWSLPFDYNPHARCPGIEAFLADRLGDSDTVSMFRAFARGLLTGERSKVFLEITGDGDTGKSVVANLLVALIGHGNYAAMTLQRLEDRTQRFETLKLRGRKLAIFSECADYSGRLEVLKKITGNDPIDGEIKGGRHVDFYYTGGVILVGNAPIRVSDHSNAVINRRRPIHIDKVVAPTDQRNLIEADGMGGWFGELVPELPGFVNWALAMPASEARQALARDVQSLHRIEAQLRALIATDNLAEWADNHLIWNPTATGEAAARVGTERENPNVFLYASYRRFIADQGSNIKPLSLKVFKSKLLSLLRGAALPMPMSNDEYKVRGVGSVVPCVRFRTAADDAAEARGVISHGYMSRFEISETGSVDQAPGTDGNGSGTDGNGSGTDREWIGNGKTPVGNGWNGWNGSEPLTHARDEVPDTPEAPGALCTGEIGHQSVPAVPSVPHKGSCRSASVTPAVPSVPDPSFPRPPQVHPDCIAEVTTWVAAALDALRDAGMPHDAVACRECLRAWHRQQPEIPEMSKREVERAYSAAAAASTDAQPDLFSAA